jgi:hypothetical protein
MEPSPQVANLLEKTINSRKRGMTRGMTATRERESDFRDLLEMQLAGVGIEPSAREYTDELLDREWADRRNDVLEEVATSYPQGREVIIGSGYHAAVYAATRVLMGNPRPLVLEMRKRPGGIFAMTDQPVFYLNSRNRKGGAGAARDSGTQPNYLLGAPVQASMISAREYSTNTEMAWIIRMTLAQYADVVPQAQVKQVRTVGGGDLQIEIDSGERIPAARIIDARGLGEPRYAGTGNLILNFRQFMERMAKPWPLRGVRRVAVVGDGDAARVTVEALLGIGPEPYMSAAQLDTVDRIDWFGGSLPTDCLTWVQRERGRYQAIGRFLRTDKFGVRKLFVERRRAEPAEVPGAALIEGTAYDLVVMATGNSQSNIAGLYTGNGYTPFYEIGGLTVARQSNDQYSYAVGPRADIGWADQEIRAQDAAIENNRTSMYRLGSRTAALAAALPKSKRLGPPSLGMRLVA